MKITFPGKLSWRFAPLQAGVVLLVYGCLLTSAAATGLLPSLALNTGWELQDAAKIDAAGEAISGPGYVSTQWLRATVPGTVLTSFVDDGIYPEPLYGENNLQIPDSLCRASYWYRKTFTLPATWQGRQIWLNFDGINYMAEVWVNGREVGDINGAFARGMFDITQDVIPGQMVAVAVHILPEPHPGKAHQKTLAAGTGRNGGETAADGPTFLCAIGWDWIPTIRDRDMGIWQGVRLTTSGPVVLREPYVTTHLPLPRLDSADATVQVTLSNLTKTAQSGVLAGQAEDGIHFRQKISLPPNGAHTFIFSPANARSLHLNHPRLWWPNGFGPQNLYHLRLQFLQNGAVSDARQVTFGVRQISYSVPDSTNLTLSVNGVPVVAKGGDWGMDEAMKRIPRARLEAMIRMHQQANYTIIRNWVGQSTSEDFYELCDKYGLLVWDEFFQPNPADGPNPDDPEIYLANVREKIVRFRNHPCIALWCARNEGNPPPVIDAGIKKLLSTLDPGRLYQPSSTSGRGVHSSGPYCWRPPRDFYHFKFPFKTEIGSMSVPTLEAVHAMMPERDWNVINDDWAEHDFCRGAQRGNLYPGILSRRYGSLTTLADFVRKAQLANYEDFRAMYEGRLCELFHPVTGVITWMSNPAQPSFVWQLYSHDLEPDAALFATRKACEPVHVMMNQDNWQVLVINNTPRRLSGLTVRTCVYDLNGSLVWSRTNQLTAGPSRATETGQTVVPGNVIRFVKLELRDARNRLVSDNFYWQPATNHPDDFTGVNQLPRVTLDVTATRREKNNHCFLKVTVYNPSRSVALLAHLQLRRATSGRRVLPVFYSDNYISLLPGETRFLTIDAAQSDLEEEAPLLAVDGWNVTAKSVAASGSSVAVIPNQAAMAIGADAPKLDLSQINK